MTAIAPTTILIGALGGEGGGVLAEWIVDAAQRAGLQVQATSVPGVAQRTGATSYYIEFMAADTARPRPPVFALMPVPGRVDVLLSSELLESVRMIERGFVDPQGTLLITATHRVLTTQEKLAPTDGRFDTERLLAAATEAAQQCLALDLQAIAQRQRTVISAVLYGALAGSGRLPWGRDIDEAVIRASGVGVENSLAGFAEAFEAARGAMPPTVADTPMSAALADTVQRGAARLLDYQDAAYAQRYRGHVESLRALASDAPAAREEAARQLALEEAARQLALWMSYEDIIRVADLKTRRERFERVRAEAGAGPQDIVQIREHLSPRLEEIAAIAPLRVGRALRKRIRTGTPTGARGQGMSLHTTSVHGFALLRLLAMLRRWRPHSLRFAEEHAAIERWLAALRDVLPLHAGYALALAELPRLRKGYSDTFERGLAHYERIFDGLVARCTAPTDADAEALRHAIAAALDIAPPPQAAPAPPAAGQAQPVVWHTRESTLTAKGTTDS